MFFILYESISKYNTIKAAVLSFKTATLFVNAQ